MKLLSTGESNTKLRKSSGLGLLLFGLSLRAADGSGYDVCPFRTAGCTKACVLEHAGRSNMPSVRKARTRKTRLYFENREQFIAELDADLYLVERQAQRAGLAPCVRLNVASDIAWEIKHPELFANHPTINFYDYTKWTKHRFDHALAGSGYTGKHMPSNYHLTYSHNEETPVNDYGTSYSSELLAAGVNVAIVYDTIYNPTQNKIGTLPTSWRIDGDRMSSIYKYDVIDGDTHDIRIAEFDNSAQPADDTRGVIVGLRGKGGKRQVIDGVDAGFIMPTIGGTAYIQ